MSLRDFSSLRLLGKGSYGRVYRATRRSDKQEYAIKEMSIAHMSEREREEGNICPPPPVNYSSTPSFPRSSRECSRWIFWGVFACRF